MRIAVHLGEDRRTLIAGGERTDTRAIREGSAEGVCAHQADHLLVVQTHAIEDMADVVVHHSRQRKAG